MRLFNLLLLLATSVSVFAQSSINVKITLSDKVITVPKENFVSLSFEEVEGQKDKFQDDIYIVGYMDLYDGVHSFYWSSKEQKWDEIKVKGDYVPETMADYLATDGTNIYAAGMINSAAPGDMRWENASIWKNWEIKSYEALEYDLCTLATDLFADGKHVYATSYGNSVNRQWSDGDVEYSIVDGSSVYSYNGDVYVARKNTILKNNEILTDTIDGTPYNMVVNAKGIHFIKRILDSNTGCSKSVLWSNGKIIETGLNLDISGQGHVAGRCMVSENDILYVVGYGKNGIPTVWKDGNLIPMLNEAKNIEIRGISVIDQRIYIVGTNRSLWNESPYSDGVPVVLTNGKEYDLREYGIDGVNNPNINAICVIRKKQ